MKKIALLVVAFIGFATAASAQTFDVGTNNITATLGFGSGNAIPVAISYEYGILDFGGDHKLGLGGNALFYSSTFGLAAECNYHYVGVEKLDLYGGVRLGVAMFDGGSSTFNSFDIGANYYFDPAWAINAEFGSKVSSISLGITHKF